jgi:hypothetical protein
MKTNETTYCKNCQSDIVSGDHSDCCGDPCPADKVETIDRIKELEEQVTEARDAYDAILNAVNDLPSHERSWGEYTSRCDINQYILQPMNRQVKEWNPVEHPELIKE